VVRRYDGFNPAASWWLKQPCEEADKALEEYGKFLLEEIAGQKGRTRIRWWASRVARRLSPPYGLRVIPYSAQELIALGERELAWVKLR